MLIFNDHFPHAYLSMANLMNNAHVKMNIHLIRPLNNF